MNFEYKNFQCAIGVWKKTKVLRQNHFHYFIEIILAFELHHSFSGNV